jgi:glycosyltransferase involved in cell wall biosynthesis
VNILNICFVIISDGWGGAEGVVFELAKFLNDENKIFIILNHEIKSFYQDLKGVELYDIGNIYNLKSLIKSILLRRTSNYNYVDKDRSLFHVSSDILKPIYLKRIHKRIESFLIENNIEIINSHLEYSDLLISFIEDISIPWISTIHGSPNYRESILVHSKNHNYIGFNIKMLINRIKSRRFCHTLHQMDGTIFVSDWLFKKYKDYVPVSSLTYTIHNGIDIREFNRDILPTKKLKGSINLIFPGGYKPLKGGKVLLESLAVLIPQMPCIHLYIALDVPEKHILRKIAKDLDLEENVTFLGFLYKEDYKLYLNSSDLLVMPSKEEAFASVFLEAMALGKPIIGGRDGGISEVAIHGKNGLIIEPTIDNLVDAIKLTIDKDTYTRMQQNNLDIRESLNWDKVAKRYIEIFEQIKRSS